MERKRSGDIASAPRVATGAAVQSVAVTDALTRSFFAEWARVGFAAISLERVARSATVGKAALYRRWPEKTSMASDLLSRVGLTITDVGDQGTLEADIEVLLLSIRRLLRHALVRQILVDLHAEASRSTDLAAAIRPFQMARRARINDLLDRAVGRGEVPANVDRAAAADLLGAPLYWRMVVLGERPGRPQIKRLARMIAAALQAGE